MKHSSTRYGTPGSPGVPGPVEEAPRWDIERAHTAIKWSVIGAVAFPVDTVHVWPYVRAHLVALLGRVSLTWPPRTRIPFPPRRHVVVPDDILDARVRAA